MREGIDEQVPIGPMADTQVCPYDFNRPRIGRMVRMGRIKNRSEALTPGAEEGTIRIILQGGCQGDEMDAPGKGFAPP